MTSGFDASPTQVARQSPLATFVNSLAIAMIFYLAAASSFSGYFGKWAFFDGRTDFGIVQVFEGSATRPWIYRTLMPSLASYLIEASDQIIPKPLRGELESRLRAFPHFSPEATYTRASAINSPDIRPRYLVLYYLTFASMLASLIVMRLLCLHWIGSSTVAIIAPTVFALVFPLLLTRGGYYYDAPELFFLCTSVLFASTGRWFWLVLLSIPATFNKEAFLFFVPSLYPVLMSRLERHQAIRAIVLMLLLSVTINILTKYQFKANAGEMIMWQLGSRLKFFLSWQSYVRLEINYGVITTAGINFLNLVLLISLYRGYWATLAQAIRQHALIAASLNVPLFLAFGYADELRNLSFLFPSMMLMMAGWINAGIVRSVTRGVILSSQPQQPMSEPPAGVRGVG